MTGKIARRFGAPLKRIRDGVRVEQRDFLEEFGVPAGQRRLPRTVCSSNESQRGASHREDDGDFCSRSARISFRRFFSIATPARAACAIFCAISFKFTAIRLTISRGAVGKFGEWPVQTSLAPVFTVAKTSTAPTAFSLRWLGCNWDRFSGHVRVAGGRDCCCRFSRRRVQGDNGR
jgi:hypothetical protein